MRHSKILIMIVFTAYTFSVFGQTDPMDKFWKDVERRKAQKQDVDQTASPLYDKLQNAIGQNIIVLQQEYVYERKNKRYVRGLDDRYGSKYGIGVRTEEGIVTSAHLLEPWVSDSSQLSNKGYTPVKTAVTFRSLVDSSYSRQEEEKYTVYIGNQLIRYSFGGDGAAESKLSLTDSSGILVLFYSTPVVDSIRREMVSYTPTWHDDASSIDSMWLHKNLIGGVYVLMDSIDDKYEFVITGILSDNISTGFKLIKLSAINQKKSSGKSGGDGGTKSNSKMMRNQDSTPKGRNS